MAKDQVVSSELKNIKNSIMRTATMLYLQLLECPNLQKLTERFQKGTMEKKHFKAMSHKIIETCNYFQCHKKEQIFPCRNGKCKYIRKLDTERRKVARELKIAENLIV